MSLSWTVPGTPIREQLRAHAKEATPKVLYMDHDRPEEIEEMMAELQATARAHGDDWVRMTYIGLAGRPWLLAHAWDRKVPAIDGEGDESFRNRIQQPVGQVVVDAVVARVQEIVNDAGIAGTVEAYNLRPNKAHFGDYASDSHADGGEFVELEGDEMEFQPGTPFDTVPLLGRDRLVVSGSASNDGTFVVTELHGDSLRYTDATGAAESLVGGTVSIVKYDVDGNVHDGFARAYLGRGYRMGSRSAKHTGIIIMPYGTTATMRAAAEAIAAQTAALGITLLVERRENP